MTDPLVYTLNSAAWMGVGIGVVLIWQRIADARAARRNEGPHRMSAMTFFGVLLIVIALVSNLFTAVYRIEQDRYEHCQAAINQQFRAGYQDRADVAAQDREAVDDLVNAISRALADPSNIGNIRAALAAYNAERAHNDAQRAQNPVVVSGSCDQPKAGGATS